MNFTLSDYSGFGIWVLISIVSSYLLVRKFKLFNGSKSSQQALTIGLILGHLVYLIWKYVFLILIGAN